MLNADMAADVVVREEVFLSSSAELSQADIASTRSVFLGDEPSLNPSHYIPYLLRSWLTTALQYAKLSATPIILHLSVDLHMLAIRGRVAYLWSRCTSKEELYAAYRPQVAAA
jgi:hypothetical protein